MKRISILFLLLFFWTSGSQAQTPKYIFLFIGDGMGMGQVQLTRDYNRSAGLPDLNFTAFPVQTFITTTSATGLVTDSAAAGTALATGSKTANYALGTDTEGNLLLSLAERAKRKGQGAGVITKTAVNHATPAAFYAHTPNRKDYQTINRQLIESDVDFLAGGGFAKDKKDSLGRDYWMAQARESGMLLWCGKPSDEARKAAAAGQHRILYLPAREYRELPYRIDAEADEVSLLDFTQAAIDQLYARYRRQGFFLMVEGGLIDFACHSNDPGTTVQEINDMDECVALALAFQARHPQETLIIVTADHETGGMAYAYDRRLNDPARLQGQCCSMKALSAQLVALKQRCGENTTWPQVRQVLQTSLGLWEQVQLTPDKEKKLKQYFKESFLDNDQGSRESDLYTTAERLARYAVSCLSWGGGVKWMDNNHTSLPVPLYVKGAGQEAFRTCRDNTDIPNTVIRIAHL